MVRLVSVLAALVVLASAAPAIAATFVVESAADGSDSDLNDGVCSSSAGCTLRAAIEQANQGSGLDAISFSSAHTVVAGSSLPAIANPVHLDGRGGRVRGSNVAISSSSVVVTRLGVEPPHRLTASSPPAPSELRIRRLADSRVELTGSAPARGQIELFRDAGATFHELFPQAVSAGPFGLLTGAGSGQYTATLTTGSGTSGFAPVFSVGDLVAPVVTAARTSDGDGDGFVDAVRVLASENLADGSGFGGVVADGLGRASTGSAPLDPEFDIALSSRQRGDARPPVRITANSTLEDSQGNRLQLMGEGLTPADGVAPQPYAAWAVTRSLVRLRFSERLDAAALTPGELSLTMAGQPIDITRLRMVEGGLTAELQAGASWPYATAGSLRLRGEIQDLAGNRSTLRRDLRVFAAPGDTTRPKLSLVRLRRHGSRRGRVTFRLSEPAVIELDLRRRGSAAPSSLRLDRRAGSGSVIFGPKVEGRRLRSGASYLVTVTAVDAAGNESRSVTRALRLP